MSCRAEILQFLLASRYCEVDRFSAIAYDLFSNLPPGGERAMAIRDWVHWKVRFDYAKARPTKTAMDVYTEREGVCRDFQHLAVTLSRAMNIPARYVTGTSRRHSSFHSLEQAIFRPGIRCGSMADGGT